MRSSIRKSKWGVLAFILLTACTALTQSPSHPTTQRAGISPTPISEAGAAPNSQLATSDRQSAIGDLRSAAHYYNRYHALASDDLLGLKRLAEVCTALEKLGQGEGETRGQGEGMKSCREAAERVSGSMLQVSSSKPPDEPETSNLEPETLKPQTPARALRAALAARSDDRRIVAGMPGVLLEAVNYTSVGNRGEQI